MNKEGDTTTLTGVRRRPSVDTNGARKSASKSPLLAEEDAKGPNLTHVLPHDLENDISEEEDGGGEGPNLSGSATSTTDDDEESDSLGSAAEYEQDLSRKRDLAQILRGGEGPAFHASGPGHTPGQVSALTSSSASTVGVTRSLLSGLSTISHNRRQAHIASEQKRRQSINEGFEDLRRAVPTCSNASDSKAVILRKAVNYINQLAGEVARLKVMLGTGVGSGAPGSPMSPAPAMHHPHMVYAHSTGHGHGHPMLQQSMPMQSMQSMSMPMQMPMQMHSPYQHPQDHPTMHHAPHHQHHGQYGSSSARQSPGPGPGSIYPSTAVVGAGGAAGRGGTVHHMSQYPVVGAPSYVANPHSLPPPPPPPTQTGMVPLTGYPTHPSGGGPPLTGATNMSYPASYGSHPGHYNGNHMPSAASRPVSVHSSHGHAAVPGHGLPPPTSVGGLPPLKAHEAYNRDDYASAASLSMLRREAPRGVGAEEK